MGQNERKMAEKIEMEEERANQDLCCLRADVIFFFVTVEKRKFPNEVFILRVAYEWKKIEAVETIWGGSYKRCEGVK